MSNEEVEKLLKVLEGEDVKEESPIISFLKYYNIQPGDNPVREQYLYQLYCQYSGTDTSKQEFKEELVKHYIFTKGFIKINIASMDLSEKAKSLLPVKKEKTQLESKRYVNSYNLFIEQMDVKDGSFWISYKDFYTSYLGWRKENRIVPRLKYNDFIKLSNEKFESKNNNVRVNEFITKEKLHEYREKEKNKKIKR